MSTVVFFSILFQLINPKIVKKNSQQKIKKAGVKKFCSKKICISITQTSSTPKLKKPASGRGFISIGSFEPRITYKFS